MLQLLLLILSSCSTKMERSFPLILIIATLVMAMQLSFGVEENQLSYNYYMLSCPNLEDVVHDELGKLFWLDPTAPAAFLRLLFHDCQVQGCDASILLDYDNSEMVSSRNFGIRMREAIDDIKSAVEVECPGQVSCADIIVLAAKESVASTGGPNIQVQLGRKDSKAISTFKEADAKLPSATISVDEFISIFSSKGMSIEEAVAILGAHTLGVGHCINIAGRLYDPALKSMIDLGFEASLRLVCPIEILPLTNYTPVPNDLTPLKFDNDYYIGTLLGRGLFGIDSNISTDPRTAPFVTRFAMDQNYFFQVFSSAFAKLAATNVLTDGQGDVRRQCNQLN